MINTPRKIVIVLGAYGGTGSEISRYNYVRGAKIVMVGRDENKLLKLSGGYDSSNAITIVGDANKSGDMRKVFSVTQEKFGEPDEIWIAVGKDGAWERDYQTDPIEKTTALWNELYPSLLKPLETVCPIAEKILRKQNHGILVHLSSHVAFKEEDELPGNYTYRRLKKAAEEIVLTMRKALKETKATAVNLRPAIINTPGNASFLDTEEKRQAAVQPEELAKWVDEHALDQNIPESHYFGSSVVL